MARRGGIGSTKTAELQDFEIRASRLYVQDRLSVKQISERLGASGPKVVDALKRCNIPLDSTRRNWITF